MVPRFKANLNNLPPLVTLYYCYSLTDPLFYLANTQLIRVADPVAVVATVVESAGADWGQVGSGKDQGEAASHWN